MTKTPRQTFPTRWATLALTSVTLAAMPAHGQPPRPAPITLANPNLWLAQAQGGEAGEAGITSEADSDTAYLTDLAIIEGHMLAARDIYAKGHTETAAELTLHPTEEGTLPDLVTRITAHGAADVSPAIAALTAAMQAKAPQADIDAALATVQQAFAAAAAPEADEVRKRFDAVVLLLKAAAGEYSAAIENGAVTDEMGWHEAQAFTQLARARLTDLAALPLSAKAAPKALVVLDDANAAFGDPMADTLLAGDPEILLTVAARLELIASQVR